MFFMYVCWANEDKVNIKQHKTLLDKYSMVVIDVSVLVQEECFSIDVSAFT